MKPTDPKMRLTSSLTPEVERLAQETIGAAIEVHRALGPGYLESVYEEALVIELQTRAIPHARQFPVAISYKNHPVGQARLDLVIDSKLVCELKAVDELAPIHAAQLLSYLKATGMRLGLLINFNVPLLKDGVRRVVL